MLGKIKRLIKKGFAYLKRYGFFKTVKKVLKTVYYRILFKLRKNQKISLFVNINLDNYSTVIIFENNFGWDKIMKQRPQQIAENFPDDVLMFYHSHEDSDYKDSKRISFVKDNLVVLDLGYHRDSLIDFLSNFYNKYLMVYSTDYIPYERIKMYEDYHYKVIYEYVDDLNEELSGEVYKDLCERHEKVLKDENVYIVSTATRLYNKIKESSDKIPALISNGVDYEHFKYTEYDMPDDLTPIRDSYKTILCYYGALANWFDYDLIKKIAENKNYAIVLIGQDYDKTLSASGVLDIDNVFFLGRKNYSELPAYGCNVDVCIIPFLINEITEATSPVKLFEYMAMEKPVVVTALPECKKYESVFYSESHEEFIANIEKAVAAASSEEHRALEIKEAQENTWQSKARDMISYIVNERRWSVKNQINEILKNENYSRIIVWRSPLGWDVPLFQRPQHIARQFARKDCLVFYEITLNTDNVETIGKAEDNLYLVNFENYTISTILDECLSAQDKPVYIQLYSTNWSMSGGELEEYQQKGYKILYEYIDDISPELAGTDEILEYILAKYKYAMSHKEVVVVTTAKQIYEDVVSQRGTDNMVFACNGVDYDFFRDLSKGHEIEDSLVQVLKNGKVNLCYYGALASWLDYELIKKIDKTNKYNIILIGVKYDAAYDESGVDSLPNVHFIGPKEYHILKYYAAEMDILTIPFVINSITQATSPLKLFEYMALHKPIVTTAMQECKNYESVMVAENHDEFIALLEKATEAAKDDEYIALLDKEARENDWSHKAETIIELLKENDKR